LLDFTPAIINEGGKEKLKLSWHVNNPSLKDGSPTSEYAVHEFYLRYGDDVLLADVEGVNSLLTQTDENGTPKKLQIPNKVNETRHYSFSPDQTAEATATAPVTADAGLQRSKAWDNSPTSYQSKYGGTHDYSTVTLTNTGIVTLDKWGAISEYELDEDGNRVKDANGKDVVKSCNGNILTDNLNYYFYITPADLETMLREKVTLGTGDKAQTLPLGDWLTVTINKASLFTPGQFQPTEGTEQSSKYTAGGESNLSAAGDNGARAYETAKIVLTSDADGVITMAVSGDPGDPSFNGTYTIGADYPSIEAAFRAMGYMPTHNTSYNLSYQMKDSSLENFSLYAGQTLKFHILGTYKTTPMMLTGDSESYYNHSSTIYTQNTANLKANVGGSQINENLSTYWQSHYWSNELYHYKYGYVNGTSFNGESESLNEGTLVDYRLQGTNYNGIAYEKMSMEDFMSGAQVLLVPKEQNPNLTAPDGSELPTHTANGVVYWVLNQPGTYTNVTLGSVNFAGNYNIQNSTQTLKTKDIVVTETTSGGKRTGLNTRIRWEPFTNWGGNSNTTYLCYKALVSGKYAGLVKEDEGDTAVKYTINNKSWLGDHQGHRLWDTLGGTYRIYGFNKYIITRNGAKDGTDTVQNGRLVEYSRVGVGELVTYQITVQNRTSLPATLNGNRIYDALPTTGGIFAWTRGDADAELAPNVLNLRYICDNGVTITAGTGEDMVQLDTHGGSNVDLKDDYWQVQPQSTAGSYRILWDKDFAINFPGRAVVKILVDLQFPERPENGASQWDQYVAKEMGKPIYNTFSLDGYTDTVSHTLEAEGKAVLYKGVYDTGWTTHTSSDVYTGAYVSNRSRLQYANGTGSVSYTDTDMKASTVTYYTVLYNGSYDRLYLSDMEDQLPRGFTFNSMCNRYDGISSLTSSSYSSRYVGYTGVSNSATYAEYYSTRQLVTISNSGDELDNNTVTYVNAQVTASTYNGADGRQHIKFKFTNYSGLNYDDVVKKYYLNPGQAIRFGYNCLVGKYADTDDLATNTIAMPYYDYYHTGFVLDVPNDPKEGEAKIGAVQQSTYRNGGNVDNRVQNNDGGCRMMTKDQVQSEYGMDVAPYGAEPYNDVVGGNWLVSDVTLNRAGITPGVQKTVGGTTIRQPNANPATIEGSKGSDAALFGSQYVGGAKTSDVINWRVRVYNEAGNGNEEVGGTMTDYTVTDTMVTPFGFTGQVFYNLYRISGNSRRTPSSQYLFTLGSRTEGDTEVRIGSGSGVGTSTLHIGVAEDDSDDQWFTFGSGARIGKVKLERNANGEEVLTVHMSGTAFTIPGGFYVELCLHTMFLADQVVISEGKYNDVVLRPEQDYDPQSVAQGRARTVSVPQEDGSMKVVNDGIQSGASIMLTQGYTTNAYKTVTELGSTSTARSDGSPNYITLTEKSKSFRYDLFVEGPQAVMAKIVIIDDLPQVGDHSAFVEADKRNSDFKVSFLETNPAFQVSLARTEGAAETVLSPDQYTLEVSEAVEFTKEDWNGGGTGWVPATEENLKTARSFRVVLTDENAWQKDQSKYLMAKKCKIHLSFNAKIDDPTAGPGQYAWNSFGYRYEVPLTQNGSEANSSKIALEAQPLSAGVRYPAAPKIIKSLEEENIVQTTVTDPDTGEESVVEQTVRSAHKAVGDLNFAFVVYEGESLPALDRALTMSKKEIASILAAENRKYLYVPVTLKDGTATDESALWTRDYADTFDAEAGTFKANPDVEWHWAGGGRYTVAEVALGDYNYSYDRLKIGTSLFRENNKSFTNDTAAIVQLSVVNLYEPEYTDIDGVKIWDDADNQDGKRPESITVHLYADGEEIDEKTVTAEDDWSWRFEHLLKEHETGVKIRYQVLEDAVEEYSTAVNASEDLFHFTVTNSYTPGQVSVSVIKNWDDANDQDGLRPKELLVHLYADGKRTEQTLRLSAENNWQGSFIGLPMMQSGEMITYTVREDPVDSYTSLMTGNAEEGFVLSNRHVPKKISIPVQKLWDDQDDADKKRPDKIVIRLLADGAATGKELILNKANGWSDSFKDLPQMANGKAIVYTIQEEKVAGYTSSVKGSPEEGFVVRNTPVVQTGDSSNLRLWILVLLLSILGLGCACYPLYRRFRKH
ncbi:MAG: Cna B-type domain-containing protein, partial [Oscillospiraceae bacterium]|nr:Cna B-type domain-containing protein [Oscillospiraceae bacterium]